MIQIGEKLLTPEEAAKYITVRLRCMTAVWRSQGRQPLPFKVVDGRIRYNISDLDHYIDQHTRPGP